MNKVILIGVLLFNLPFKLNAMEVETNIEDGFYIVTLEKGVRLPLETKGYNKPSLLKKLIKKEN